MKDFFVRWGKGMRSYASSPIGMVHSQLIITGFIVFGLFLGAVDQKLRGNGVVGFVLFAFGCLQVFSFVQLWKQYSLLLNQKSLFSKLKGVDLK